MGTPRKKPIKTKKVPPPPTPKQPKPWDIPPPPKNGSEDIRDIFFAAGWALDSWNYVENSFGALYSDLNEFTIGGEALMRSYGSVTTFKAKADMLAAAAEVYFHKYPSSHRLRFKWVLDQALGFAARRNEIAHGIVARYRWFVPRKDKGVGLGFVLGPSVFSTSKRSLHALRANSTSPVVKPKYVYSHEEILDLGGRFGELNDLVLKLHDVLWSENWDRQPALPQKRLGRLRKPKSDAGRNGPKG